MSSWKLKAAARALHQGRLIAYPTEAVYGLGCDPWNPAAIQKLLNLKQRPVTKGLILIAAEFEQLLPFIRLPPASILERILSSWPGPVTWLLPVADNLPTWLCGEHSSIATRVTAHPLCADLCRAFGGALISTSANPAGQRPARSALKIRTYFPHTRQLHLIRGPLGNLQRPTPIFDALTGRCLRP